jgi:hypothetical protein
LIEGYLHITEQIANSHAWKKALLRAGIDNFRWHDLRHIWTSGDAVKCYSRA